MQGDDVFSRLFNAFLRGAIGFLILGCIYGVIRFVWGIGKTSRHYYKNKQTGQIIVIEETWRGKIVASFIPDDFDLEPLKDLLPHLALDDEKNAECETMRDQLVKIDAKSRKFCIRRLMGEDVKPSDSSEGLSHTIQTESKRSEVPCKGCGKQLTQAQVDYMLGNPEYNEWCREGYCRSACFEKHKDKSQNQS